MDESEVVLVWARGHDAALTVRMLQRHGHTARECSGLDDLLEGIVRSGCAVITTETLTYVGREALAGKLAKQPPWSDFPLVLFAPPRTNVARITVFARSTLRIDRM